MRNLILLLVILTANTGAMAKPRWKLVWFDEFSYTGLPDTARWDYEYGCSIRNKESQFYTRNELSNTRVENGVLVIEAHKKPIGNCTYTSGSVISRLKGDWLYGRIEVRAKLPEGRGIWPAIWMMPTHSKYGSWPRSGEIDLMEFLGYMPDTVFFTVHTEEHNRISKPNKGTRKRVEKLQQEFHTYALEWFANRVDFYVDNHKMFTFKKEADDPTVWPFDQPFYLILNVAVGGSWAAQSIIDEHIFPQRMEVDYVRVYQKKRLFKK